MKRFQNILAVYNDLVGGDDVLSHATKLAHANQADLTIIDILPQGASLAELAERRKRLDRILTSIRTEGVNNVVPIVAAGTAFKAKYAGEDRDGGRQILEGDDIHH